MYQSILSVEDDLQPLVKTCGYTGGVPFVNVTRSDGQGDCPTGYTACSTKTSPENTVCYPAAANFNSCPITDIKFDTTANSETLAAQGYSIVSLGT